MNANEKEFRAMNKKKSKYYQHPLLTEKPIVLYPAGVYGQKMLALLAS